MNVLVLSASGKAGKLILEESINKGFKTTALVKEIKEKNPNVDYLVKDILDLTEKDIEKYDVIVSAFGEWRKEYIATSFERVYGHLIKLLENKNKRLIILGGACSLYMDELKSKFALDVVELPDDIKPVAKAHFDLSTKLSNITNVNWTIFCPALFFDPEGKSTNDYTLGTETVILNNKGNSYLSYADASKAIVNEIENKKFISKKFTAVSNE